ncbi:MAG: hypothetical protein CMN30_10100 [Sandaracinus sp.]|nr:hypothetical protein [Sandaracinus sp.]
MIDDDDSLDEALGALGTHDVDDWRREHVRLRAQAVLRGEPLGFYTRFVEPTLTAVVCVLHLAWAIARVAMLLVS